MNNRKRQIVRAARSLFIEKGFSNTSIMDIIAAADISKGTFYNHFNSKNECLIAILNETREEAMNQRYEIGLNEDPSNIDVLIEQVSILIHVNRKQNLIKIFESISGVSDVELKNVLNYHYLDEIKWLSGRLTDVYGKKIEAISYECACLVLGMIQQMMRTIFIITNEYSSPERIVKMAIRNIDVIIQRMSASPEELILTNEVFEKFNMKLNKKKVTKEALIEQLSGFVNMLTDADPENGIEYAHHLLSELQGTDLKLFVLETILTSFNKAFIHTPHEAEAREIANSFWLFLKEPK